MTTFTYRANLHSQSFPFVAAHAGRSIIVPNKDSTYAPPIAAHPEDGARDFGSPQVLYCHNALPVAEGYASAGFSYVGGCPGTSPVYAVILIRDPASNVSGYLFMLQDGHSWFYNGATWIVGTYVEAPFTTELITSATVMERTFIYIEGRDAHEFNYTTQTLQPVLFNFDPINPPPGPMIGITTGLGRLVAWDKNTVYWCADTYDNVPFNPIDFVPSDVTGAGFSSVAQAQGTIKYCKAHLLGFMVYCQNNIVTAIATNNSLFPYNFRELVGSGGAIHYEDIAQDAKTTDHVAYTTSGLQFVSYQQTNTKFPELTDFISGRYFEDYDETTHTWTRRSVQYFKHAVNVVSDRYLMISYGDAATPIAGNPFSHVLVWDMVMQRWGKLKFHHLTIFEDTAFGSGIIDMQPKSGVMFVKSDGTIHKLEFDPHETGVNHSGVIIFGHYQIERGHLTSLVEGWLDNVPVAGKTWSMRVYPNYDGKNAGATLFPLTQSSGETSKFYCRASGQNLDIGVFGNFRLSSLVLRFKQDGVR